VVVGGVVVCGAEVGGLVVRTGWLVGGAAGGAAGDAAGGAAGDAIGGWYTYT
jgi:hypothetical protein